MITISGSLALDRFNVVFARYMEATSKLPDQVLAKKGRDLGIQLFKAFVQRKWGGPGKHEGLARAELDARTKGGKGTKVRGSLLEKYRQERDALRKEAKKLKAEKHGFSGTLDQWSGMEAAIAANREHRVSLWQSTVGKEIAIRQHGIGALAAAFLWYRTRPATATRGKTVVKNKNGKAIGFAEAGDGTFRIVSDVDGTAVVDRRYGLVDQALNALTADMLVYFRERHALLYQSVFNEMEAVK